MPFIRMSEKIRQAKKKKSFTESKIDKFALPCREFYRGQLRYRSVDIKTFWKWADTHRDIITWEKYEKYNISEEKPDVFVPLCSFCIFLYSDFCIFLDSI